MHAQLVFRRTYSPDNLRRCPGYLQDVETIQGLYVFVDSLLEIFDRPFVAEIYFRYS